VRLTLDDEAVFRFEDLGKPFETSTVITSLIPQRELQPGEQYRFHFDMTKCIGCRSCEVACNEQNGNPADIRWRRIGEIEGGEYPDTLRHYLSMGCNHCVDADCVRGCPVEAYTKDPVTGIVLHSADACIGCQYCVWNCPYSVPQFNADRGVVGKCDMCHGRLTDGLEPACVNACPEAAIEIEIVNIADWKTDYLTAESPGMPDAAITISTTRITLPKHTPTTAMLNKVDTDRVRPEHAHLSLVLMTTLVQAVVGALAYSIAQGQAAPMPLAMLLAITALALQVSVFHLGRPGYAWRAVKMWKRSWLSREVVLFGMFFVALAALTAASWASAMHLFPVPRIVFQALEAAAILSGGAGTVASACIYLVPARPAWNMVHTPVDFILSAALMGVPLPFVLERLAAMLRGVEPQLYDNLSRFGSEHFPALAMRLPAVQGAFVAVAPLATTYAGALGAGVAAAWLINLGIKITRLRQSQSFEEKASFTLLSTEGRQAALIAAFALVAAAGAAMLANSFTLGFALAMAGVMMSRYLFFVSVVPLNMALTYVRRHAA
jgi:DMSO reductase iron-sulfur subunit